MSDTRAPQQPASDPIYERIAQVASFLVGYGDAADLGARRLREILRDMDAAPAAQQPVSDDAPKPYAFAIVIENEQRVELVHDLDDAIDDLTNCICEVVPLYERAPAAQQPASLADLVYASYPNEGEDAAEALARLRGVIREAAAQQPAEPLTDAPALREAMAVVRDAGYLITPPDRPTDRINLANLRRVMDDWHNMACSLGYDGVKGVMEQAGAAAAKGRHEH